MELSYPSRLNYSILIEFPQWSFSIPPMLFALAQLIRPNAFPWSSFGGNKSIPQLPEA
jgi:hypothetical protein